MLHSNPGNDFSGIVSDAMRDANLGCVRLEEILSDMGYSISFRRISDYANGKRTPSIENAKAILSALEVEMDDDTLKEALAQNKERIKSETEYVSPSNRKIVRTVNIKLSKLLPGYTPDEAEAFFWNRIRWLYGDERKISLYIQGLIAKDLGEFILDKEVHQ